MQCFTSFVHRIEQEHPSDMLPFFLPNRVEPLGTLSAFTAGEIISRFRARCQRQPTSLASERSIKVNASNCQEKTDSVFLPTTF
jgi:hypothetical protein